MARGPAWLVSRTAVSSASSAADSNETSPGTSLISECGLHQRREPVTRSGADGDEVRVPEQLGVALLVVRVQRGRLEHERLVAMVAQQARRRRERAAGVAPWRVVLELENVDRVALKMLRGTAQHVQVVTLGVDFQQVHGVDPLPRELGV